jgi:hypothetical protein
MNNDYFADFYQFGCGKFLKTATIPDHKTSIGKYGHLSNFYLIVSGSFSGTIYVALIKIPLLWFKLYFVPFLLDVFLKSVLIVRNVIITYFYF